MRILLNFRIYFQIKEIHEYDSQKRVAKKIIQK